MSFTHFTWVDSKDNFQQKCMPIKLAPTFWSIRFISRHIQDLAKSSLTSAVRSTLVQREVWRECTDKHCRQKLPNCRYWTCICWLPWTMKYFHVCSLCSSESWCETNLHSSGLQNTINCEHWRRLHRARGNVPSLLQMAGNEGTTSRKGANKKLIKLYWPSRKLSLKRLILLYSQKSRGARLFPAFRAVRVLPPLSNSFRSHWHWNSTYEGNIVFVQ